MSPAPHSPGPRLRFVRARSPPRFASPRGRALREPGRRDPRGSWSPSSQLYLVDGIYPPGRGDAQWLGGDSRAALGGDAPEIAANLERDAQVMRHYDRRAAAADTDGRAKEMRKRPELAAGAQDARASDLVSDPRHSRRADRLAARSGHLRTRTFRRTGLRHYPGEHGAQGAPRGRDRGPQGADCRGVPSSRSSGARIPGVASRPRGRVAPPGEGRRRRVPCQISTCTKPARETPAGRVRHRLIPIEVRYEARVEDSSEATTPGWPRRYALTGRSSASCS